MSGGGRPRARGRARTGLPRGAHRGKPARPVRRARGNGRADGASARRGPRRRGGAAPSRRAVRSRRAGARGCGRRRVSRCARRACGHRRRRPRLRPRASRAPAGWLVPHRAGFARPAVPEQGADEGHGTAVPASRARTENGRRVSGAGRLRRLTARGALTTMCRDSDRCSVRPNSAERGTMASTVGVISAAITCFGDDDHIDDGRTREHLEWIIEGGVHAVIVSGTCGEFSTLSPDERRHLITKFVEWVDGRIPVFAGVMHTSTHVAVSLARHAQEAGATAVMSVSPYYSGPPEREILTYFRDIAGAVDIPLIVYNNPWSSGVSLSVSALATLANEGTAAMIKDSHGDPSRLHDLRALVPASTSLIYGEDFGSFEALLVGADGWVAGVANFMPRRAVRLWDLIAAGKFDEARRHWYDILPLVNITSHKEFFGLAEERPDFIQVYKAALEILGFPAGGCRRPLLPLTEADTTLLKKLIAEGGLARESA